MCCRYYVDELAEREAFELADLIDAGVQSRGAGQKDPLISVSLPEPDRYPSDRHPSDMACVLYGNEGKLHAGQMRWGFPSYRSGNLMINARCESALQKPMFSDSVMRRRCVIPASGFYEWDRDKNKVTFRLPDEPCMFLAGFYNLFDAQPRYIILTTQANESMAPVHDRMPLILPKNEIADWIYEPGKTQEYLRSASPRLQRSQEYEQLRLLLEEM